LLPLSRFHRGFTAALRLVLVAPLAGCLGGGCAQVRPADRSPGETDTKVHRVSIVAKDGSKLPVAPSPLLPKLGQRAGGLVYTDRYFNPYRLAEDKRRVLVWLQTLGYLDAVVEEPRVVRDEAKHEVDITFVVTPNERYRWGEVVFVGVPEDAREAVAKHQKAFPGGTEPDLELVRVARYDMANELSRAGYGHARMLVRFHVDKETKRIGVTHLADPGPKTTIGRVTVRGANKVKEADVIARAGLFPGQPFTLTRKEKAETDLLDTGAFAAATAVTTADTEFYLGDVPDSGGPLPDERVAEDGSLLPRTLPETIDIELRVHEAPGAKLGVRATAEADPTRGDVVASATGDFRNALGSLRHFSLRGTLGYGFFSRGDERDPTGLYGSLHAQITLPGLFGRLGDARLGGGFRDQLLPGYHFREVRIGPGMRSAFSRHGFVDLEAVYRRGSLIGLSNDQISAGDRSRVALPADGVSQGAELAAQIVFDARDDAAEPMKGGFLALRSAYSPGGALADQRYVLVAPEMRGFLPLRPGLSLGLRASGGVIVGETSAGVPLGPRLFGGGAYGFRGFGRDRLSPRVTACAADGSCRTPVVGGLSLVESALELRYLPPLAQAGLVGFVDAGGAGAGQNPFANGLDLAVGLGPRIRLWYLPIAIDVSYHFLRDSRFGGHDVLAFLRVGEAF
jgi:outer membrane translocation and assembly module TamA